MNFFGGVDIRAIFILFMVEVSSCRHEPCGYKYCISLSFLQGILNVGVFFGIFWSV